MAILITPKIKKYALGIAAVGERMKKTGNSFGEVGNRPVSTLEDLIEKKKDFEKLLGEFKSQEQTLKSLGCPIELISDHKKLLVSFEKYVRATELAIESLDTEKFRADDELFSKASNLQWEASNEIVEISNAMANKLGI